MLNYVAKDLAGDEPYYAHWATLLGLVSYQPYEVAIVGQQALDRSKQMRAGYLPTSLFMGGDIENLPLLENKKVEGRTMIYVCRNKTCKMPVENAENAMQQLIVRAGHL